MTSKLGMTWTMRSSRTACILVIICVTVAMMYSWYFISFSNIPSSFGLIFGTPDNMTIQDDKSEDEKLDTARNRSQTSNSSVNLTTKSLSQVTLFVKSNTTTPSIVVNSYSAASDLNSCKVSPFIICNDTEERNNFNENRTYRIAYLRQPSWNNIKTFSRCKYNMCIFDSAVTEKTDVVLVYGVGLNSEFKPPRRWPHQLYGFVTWESPRHTWFDGLYRDKSIWKDQFNLTLTYRVDSDVFLPYAKLRYNPKPPDKRPNYRDIAKQKTRMAAWFVSNCHTWSQRDKYVDQMKQYIDIDIYGGCGTPCESKDYQCTNNLPSYHFYLAFENSLCTDYISEKFFKTFNPGWHIIPVVRGGADYEKYFSPFTFINAARFKKAADLARYLKAVAEDTDLYVKYLEHADMYEKAPDFISQLGCGLCEMLHKGNYSSKVRNIKSWFSDNHCHPPRDL